VVFNVVDLPVVTSVVVTVQVWQTPAVLQPAPVTMPRIRSPGATTMGVVCMSLPERQQRSLSIDHLPCVSPLKSRTG
jgi:hypothetical protein